MHLIQSKRWEMETVVKRLKVIEVRELNLAGVPSGFMRKYKCKRWRRNESHPEDSIL